MAPKAPKSPSISIPPSPNNGSSSPTFRRGSQLSSASRRSVTQSPGGAASPSSSRRGSANSPLSPVPQKVGNKIQVAVRCRPLNAQEKGLSNKSVWHINENVVEELGDDGVKPTGKDYSYDHVFSEDTSNEAVYESTCKHIVESALQGYNGTVFAYGQTSSGKTHTLMGESTNPGVTPRAFEEVFKWIGSHPSAQWDVSASYIELYNEQIRDLLQTDSSKGSNLKIIDDKNLGPTVQSLTETRVVNVQHLLSVLRDGEKRRSYGSTAMNANSSRSHTLFRLQISSRSMVADNAEETAEKMRTVANEFMGTRSTIGADNGSLYIVDTESQELYIQSGDITLRMPMGQGIAGAVATTGVTANIPDAYQDPRFNPAVDKRTGYITKAILCVPIHGDGKVVGVVQFINKKTRGIDCFSESDAACVTELTKKIGPLIVEAQAAARTSLMSRLNLVDLAGSERVQKTGATGTRLTEAANINTSLMTLGTIIALLSEGKNQHIPFRNSKLTHLLSSSLGGNANTAVICTFSPASRNRHETVSTFQFASRAKKIVNEVKQNCHVDQAALLAQYEGEIAKLKEQLQEKAVSRNPSKTDDEDVKRASKPTYHHGASFNDSREQLDEEFDGKLEKLKHDLVDAERVINAAAPPNARRVSLEVFYAVRAAGDGVRPEPLIRMTRDPANEVGLQASARELKLAFSIESIDFDAMTATQINELSSSIKTIVASNTGVAENSIIVTLSAGSVVVDVTITVPDQMDVTIIKGTLDVNRAAITTAVVSDAGAIVGLETTSAIHVTGFATSALALAGLDTTLSLTDAEWLTEPELQRRISLIQIQSLETPEAGPSQSTAITDALIVDGVREGFHPDHSQCSSFAPSSPEESICGSSSHNIDACLEAGHGNGRNTDGESETEDAAIMAGIHDGLGCLVLDGIPSHGNDTSKKAGAFRELAFNSKSDTCIVDSQPEIDNCFGRESDAEPGTANRLILPGMNNGLRSSIFKAMPEHATASPDNKQGLSSSSIDRTVDSTPYEHDDVRNMDSKSGDAELRGLVMELNTLLTRQEEEHTRDKDHLQAQLTSISSSFATFQAEFARACEERDSLRTKLQQTETELQRAKLGDTHDERDFLRAKLQQTETELQRAKISEMQERKSHDKKELRPENFSETSLPAGFFKEAKNKAGIDAATRTHGSSFLEASRRSPPRHFSREEVLLDPLRRTLDAILGESTICRN